MTHWNHEYYEVAEHYFWEPQKLQTTAQDGRSPVKDVVESLRRLEVTTNHQLNLFFRLAPRQSIARWISSILGSNFGDEYSLRTRDETLETFAGTDITQPDFLFVGSGAMVGVEMKRNAGAYLEQFAKYLIAHVFDEAKYGRRELHGVILLHQKDFADAWVSGEQYKHMAEVGERLREYEFPEKARGIDLTPHRARLEELRSHVSLGSVTFEELWRFLHGELQTVPERLEVAEPYRRLLQGILAELESLR